MRKHSLVYAGGPFSPLFPDLGRARGRGRARIGPGHTLEFMAKGGRPAAANRLRSNATAALLRACTLWTMGERPVREAAVM
mmetsp:Transcript_62020/g.102982  ORF Transcript_62020/g.102982 Transcript_62020/m.102982 type:complete len:81 (-) Transcript_62020:333-575(-)